MNEKKTRELYNGQPYAEDIERILRKLVDCDRGGLMGIIDSDIIRSNPELSIKCALSHVYSKAEACGNQAFINKMIDFLNKYHIYLKLPIDTILQMRKGENKCKNKTINLSMSGENALKMYISELNDF